MQFETWSNAVASVRVDCLILGVFDPGELIAEARDADEATGGRLKKLISRGDFAGRAAETLLVSDLPGLAASRVLLTGLGARKAPSDACHGARHGRQQ